MELTGSFAIKRDVCIYLYESTKRQASVQSINLFMAILVDGLTCTARDVVSGLQGVS